MPLKQTHDQTSQFNGNTFSIFMLGPMVRFHNVFLQSVPPGCQEIRRQDLRGERKVNFNRSQTNCSKTTPSSFRSDDTVGHHPGNPDPQTFDPQTFDPQTFDPQTFDRRIFALRTFDD